MQQKWRSLTTMATFAVLGPPIGLVLILIVGAKGAHLPDSSVALGLLFFAYAYGALSAVASGAIIAGLEAWGPPVRHGGSRVLRDAAIGAAMTYPLWLALFDSQLVETLLIGAFAAVTCNAIARAILPRENARDV